MLLQVQQCLNLEIDDVFLLGRSGDLQDVAPATVCCQSVVLVTLTIKWPQLAFDTVLGLRQRSAAVNAISAAGTCQEFPSQSCGAR